MADACAVSVLRRRAHWSSQTSIHNPMLDEKPSLADHPNPSAARRLLPQRLRPSIGEAVPDRARRAAAVDLRPRTAKFTLIDTCFTTHHLVFAEMPTTRCGSAPVARRAGSSAGSTQMFDATGDERKSQGWTALILDTNATASATTMSSRTAGRSTKDKRILAALRHRYNPVDGSIWARCSYPAASCASCRRQSTGTALAEYYEVPFNDRRRR